MSKVSVPGRPALADLEVAHPPHERFALLHEPPEVGVVANSLDLQAVTLPDALVCRAWSETSVRSAAGDGASTARATDVPTATTNLPDAPPQAALSDLRQIKEASPPAR